MKLSEDLRSLVEEALADQKLSKKEKEVLIQKAEKEGIDRAAFEIYLDGELYKEKVRTGTDGNLIIKTYRIYQNNLSKKSKVRIGLLIFIVIFCILAYRGCDYALDACPDCGCVNLDDCISKYKFEEARKYAGNWQAASTDMNKVIIAEAQYCISQKQFNRAFILSKELAYRKIGDSNEEFHKLLSEIISAKIQENDLNDINAVFSGYDLIVLPNNTYKINSYLQIIRKFCEVGEKTKATDFIQNMPEKLTIKEEEVYIYNSDGSNEKEETASCRKKYNAIKTGLKQNQVIEPFKESHSDYYKITTYEYPRKEAKKILEECKNVKKKGN